MTSDAEEFGRAALRSAYDAMQPLLDVMETWERHALILLHPTAVGYASARQNRPKSLLLDDGTCVLSYTKEAAALELRSNGYCLAAEGIERESTPGKLYIVACLEDSSEVLWASREMHDGYEGTLSYLPGGARLTTMDGSPLPRSVDESIGAPMEYMASYLQDELEDDYPVNKISEDDLVFVRVTSGCPLYKSVRLKARAESVTIPDSGPVDVVMSYMDVVEFLRDSMEESFVNDISNRPTGSVTLMKFDGDGCTAYHAKLVLPTKKDAS